MKQAVDVAIVGAGPYGLSLAAHLHGAGVPNRQFGIPMRPWRTAMPEGMFLKSQGFASNLSAPLRTHTLADFCRQAGRPYADYGLPVPLGTFIDYGRWFASELVPDLEETLVTELVKDGACFLLTLATGETLRARRVVVATGIEYFAHVPGVLAGLPSEACSHSGDHRDLSPLAGRQVVVMGAGQSALETAALLHEQGTSVRVVMRKRDVRWNGEPLALDRPYLQRLREPEAGLGSGWSTWFYSRHPDMFRHLPTSVRVQRARTALGPAGASWLRPRVEGVLPIIAGTSVSQAQAGPGGVTLRLEGPGGEQEITADHVIAATGYRPGADKLPFLGEDLRGGLRTLAGTPVLSGNYESSVPGLYFMGPGVAPTFGPVMRFVYGSDHAARAAGAHLAATAQRTTAVPAGASR
jgi:pyridine nucleotide-disulfide oxidoreductase